jgi:hypothetical protein
MNLIHYHSNLLTCQEATEISWGLIGGGIMGCTSGIPSDPSHRAGSTASAQEDIGVSAKWRNHALPFFIVL